MVLRNVYATAQLPGACLVANRRHIPLLKRTQLHYVDVCATTQLRESCLPSRRIAHLTFIGKWVELGSTSIIASKEICGNYTLCDIVQVQYDVLVYKAAYIPEPLMNRMRGMQIDGNV